MKSTREVQILVCDGCDYLIGEEARLGRADVVALSIPWRRDGSDRGVLDFHFHAPSVTDNDRDCRDCLRYFILNPRIVEQALERRGLHEAEIERFLAQVSFRPAKAPA